MDSLASFLHLLQQVISFEMKRLLKLDGQRPVGCFIDIIQLPQFVSIRDSVRVDSQSLC